LAQACVIRQRSFEELEIRLVVLAGVDVGAVIACCPWLRHSRVGRPAALALWRDRDFVRLWVGQAASQLGAQSSQVTLPLVAVLALNSGADRLGVLRAVQQAPILLISLFVGAWVDRWRARNVMMLADLGRALVLAAIPVAFVLGVLGMPLMLVVALVVGVLTVFFDAPIRHPLYDWSSGISWRRATACWKVVDPRRRSVVPESVGC
jgi:hypothetical protein